MIRIIEVILLVCLAGFFDYMMDAIKDYGKSDKFWLWNWCRGSSYENWYLGHHSFPFLEKRGILYNPAYPWTSDAWHLMKHGMLLSWSGAVACNYNHWYYIIPIWWLAYFIEGIIFNLCYQRLK